MALDTKRARARKGRSSSVLHEEWEHALLTRCYQTGCASCCRKRSEDDRAGVEDANRRFYEAFRRNDYKVGLHRLLVDMTLRTRHAVS